MLEACIPLFVPALGPCFSFDMNASDVGAIGVIWSVLVNNLLNERGLPLGWTLRIIAFMQLAMLTIATLLVQPRFPRGHAPLQPLSLFDALKRYVKGKRTMIYTFGMVLVNLGVYIPWVSAPSSIL